MTVNQLIKALEAEQAIGRGQAEVCFREPYDDDAATYEIDAVIRGTECDVPAEYSRAIILVA